MHNRRSNQYHCNVQVIVFFNCFGIIINLPLRERIVYQSVAIALGIEPLCFEPRRWRPCGVHVTLVALIPELRVVFVVRQ